MSRFLDKLTAQLAADADASMRRSLRALPGVGRHVRVGGRELLNLASNDYLGLATDPRLADAAIDATRQLGAGGTASRLVVGHLDIHAQAERAVADLKHAEAALLLPTGFMANLAVLTTLPGPGDLICIDKLTHASLLDAARYSDAHVRVFPHRNHDKLERLIRRHTSEIRNPQSEIFIVTDSVFSMDGTCADLPGLCALARRYDAVLVVDEAHATGVLGPSGAGLAQHQGVADRIDITISTASKALGGVGGMVTGARAVIDTLVSKARPFIYTTASPPAAAATLLAAIRIVRDEPDRRQRLRDICVRVTDALPGRFKPALGAADPPVPIIPLVTGSPESALALADRLGRRGILAVAIRPPTVAPGASRVRLCLRGDLSDDEVGLVIDAVRDAGR